MKVRPDPCEFCPYRCDVPSGLWASDEYDKLPDYDRPTADQPMAVFACHASPQAFCHGWVVVHTSRGQAHDLLALRISQMMGRWDGVIPEPTVALFGSGAEAAAHGQAAILTPSQEAKDAVARLTRKHKRLRDE